MIIGSIVQALAFIGYGFAFLSIVIGVLILFVKTIPYIKTNITND